MRNTARTGNSRTVYPLGSGGGKYRVGADERFVRQCTPGGRREISRHFLSSGPTLSLGQLRSSPRFLPPPPGNPPHFSGGTQGGMMASLND
jgi:hypothetical protein